ncbi:hypothetical protein JX265_014084, partial [Neoarthrinium moseri]
MGTPGISEQQRHSVDRRCHIESFTAHSEFDSICYDSDVESNSSFESVEDCVDEGPDFYDDLLATFKAQGPTLANHSRNTKRMEEEQEEKWNEFCKRRGVNSLETLKECNAATFKTASWMKEDVLYDVRNWIHTYLTPAYRLDRSKAEKAGIYVEDLAVLLNHHWVRDKEVFAHERLRVQLAAHLILAGATATRPGALIGQLLYENLEF